MECYYRSRKRRRGRLGKIGGRPAIHQRINCRAWISLYRVVMNFKIYSLLLFTFHITTYGQEFSLLRQNDDLAQIDSIENKNLYQNLKTMVMFQNSTISFGGSWRFQSESFINGEFEQNGSQDNIWYLNRFLAHAHLKVGGNFEIFTELGSSFATGKDDISPIDIDEIYVNQLFARYKFTPCLDIAAGRQHLRLGSGRLIDIREGPNVRRLFDFAEINFQYEKF